MYEPMNEIVQETECKSVTLDTPCTKCNYNLRGLDMSGQCPECSTPVNESGHGLSLRCANVKWLERVYVGLALLPWGLAFVVAQSFIVVWWSENPQSVTGSARAIVWMLWYCSWMCHAGTILVCTTQEPRLRFVESVVSLRHLLRLCATLILIGATVFFVGYWYPGLRRHLIQSDLDRISLVLGFFTLGVWLLIGLYLSEYANRIEYPGLRAKSVSITLGLAAVSLVTVLIRGVADAMGWNLSESTGPVTLLLGVIGIAGIVYLIRYVFLLLEYKREFRSAYKAACDSRAGATGEC